MAVDWTDPCARATALREAYYNLIGGSGVVRVMIKGADTMQDTTFQQADRATLLSELRKAEDECLAVTDGKPRRFAIRAGSARFPGNR